MFRNLSISRPIRQPLAAAAIWVAGHLEMQGLSTSCTANTLGKPHAHPLRLEMVGRRTSQSASPATPSRVDRLAQVARLGLAPKVIFDCGAFTGAWAAGAARVFPGAQLVLIEPNPRQQAILRQNTARIDPPPIIVESAVGSTEGTASLNVWDNEQTSLAGSSLLDHVQGEAMTKISVKVETIDTIARQIGKTPEFLKLDLQGYELPALEGATQVLRTAEFCQIEFGVLEAYIGRSTPRQILDLMYDNHYTLYDVIDLIYRPYDGALTGGDFFFVKNGSSLRKYKGYR